MSLSKLVKWWKGEEFEFEEDTQSHPAYVMDLEFCEDVKPLRVEDNVAISLPEEKCQDSNFIIPAVSDCISPEIKTETDERDASNFLGSASMNVDSSGELNISSDAEVSSSTDFSITKLGSTEPARIWQSTPNKDSSGNGRPLPVLEQENEEPISLENTSLSNHEPLLRITPPAEPTKANNVSTAEGKRVTRKRKLKVFLEDTVPRRSTRLLSKSKNP